MGRRGRCVATRRVMSAVSGKQVANQPAAIQVGELSEDNASGVHSCRGDHKCVCVKLYSIQLEYEVDCTQQSRQT